MTAKTLLELKNIEVSFKTRHGVLKADDLSLTVQEGETGSWASPARQVHDRSRHHRPDRPPVACRRVKLVR